MQGMCRPHLVHVAVDGDPLQSPRGLPGADAIRRRRLPAGRQKVVQRGEVLGDVGEVVLVKRDEPVAAAAVLQAEVAPGGQRLGSVCAFRQPGGAGGDRVGQLGWGGSLREPGSGAPIRSRTKLVSRLRALLPPIRMYKRSCEHR